MNHEVQEIIILKRPIGISNSRFQVENTIQIHILCTTIQIDVTKQVQHNQLKALNIIFG